MTPNELRTLLSGSIGSAIRENYEYVKGRAVGKSCEQYPVFLTDRCRDALLAELGDGDRGGPMDEPEPSCPHWQAVRPGKWQCSIEEVDVHTCEWHWDSDGCWRTQCGKNWCFENGTAKENGLLFCPCCGRRQVEISHDPEEEIKVRRSVVIGLQDEREAALEQLAALRAKLQEAETIRFEWVEKAEALRARCEAAEKLTASYKSDRGSAWAEIQELKTSLINQSKVLNDKIDECVDLKSERDAALQNACDLDRCEINKGFSQAIKERDALSTRCETIEGTALEARRAFSEMLDRAVDVESECDALKDRLADSERKWGDAAIELDRLKARCEELGQKYKLCDDRLTKTESERDTARNRIKSQDAALTDLEGDCAKLVIERDRFKAELAEAKAGIVTRFEENVRERLIQARAETVERLRPWTEHKTTCPLNPENPQNLASAYVELECNCGLDKALGGE